MKDLRRPNPLAGTRGLAHRAGLRRPAGAGSVLRRPRLRGGYTASAPRSAPAAV